MNLSTDIHEASRELRRSAENALFTYFDNPDHSGIRSPFDAMDLQRLLDGPNSSANRPVTIVQPGSSRALLQ